jgi:hypothetical protein
MVEALLELHEVEKLNILIHLEVMLIILMGLDGLKSQISLDI